jgi:hypothetical protein
MGLYVNFDTATDYVTDTDYPATWQVSLDQIHPCHVVLRGFGRRVDAEIAMRAIQELPIDWDLPEDELRKQWNDFGGREEVMKRACKNLQW